MAMPKLPRSSAGKGTFCSSSKSSSTYYRLTKAKTLLKHSRLLHTRLLLWRPLFCQKYVSKNLGSAHSSSTGVTDIAQTINTHCRAECVKIGQQLVTHVHGVLGNQQTYGIPYWYTTYCKFQINWSNIKCKFNVDRHIHGSDVINCGICISRSIRDRFTVQLEQHSTAST